jgi:hypothetical protein
MTIRIDSERANPTQFSPHTEKNVSNQFVGFGNKTAIWMHGQARKKIFLCAMMDTGFTTSLSIVKIEGQGVNSRHFFPIIGFHVLNR